MMQGDRPAGQNVSEVAHAVKEMKGLDREVTTRSPALGPQYLLSR